MRNEDGKKEAEVGSEGGPEGDWVVSRQTSLTPYRRGVVTQVTKVDELQVATASPVDYRGGVERPSVQIDVCRWPIEYWQNYFAAGAILSHGDAAAGGPGGALGDSKGSYGGPEVNGQFFLPRASIEFDEFRLRSPGRVNFADVRGSLIGLEDAISIFEVGEIGVEAAGSNGGRFEYSEGMEPPLKLHKNRDDIVVVSHPYQDINLVHSE
ncbi:hypothetical protein WN55_03510 [Dufourea novaeangliae]|uniref:Uncharacterized protein n=1 Tax=Dufourea novaeangliae TaxID=178035 RepID=A0A154PJG8_DUFNO|nr:hypothetical protein WN55_03510 [Dufourea novaeangliae]